mmetsp:Transcript_83524/g.180189  ORF Transcript_83524/g.180189 Transcript_83524/m.180189 type:complete len:214 (+) Transcript_83524:1018-1659(+)
MTTMWNTKATSMRSRTMPDSTGVNSHSTLWKYETTIQICRPRCVTRRGRWTMTMLQTRGNPAECTLSMMSIPAAASTTCSFSTEYAAPCSKNDATVYKNAAPNTVVMRGAMTSQNETSLCFASSSNSLSSKDGCLEHMTLLRSHLGTVSVRQRCMRRAISLHSRRRHAAFSEDAASVSRAIPRIRIARITKTLATRLSQTASNHARSGVLSPA